MRRYSLSAAVLLALVAGPLSGCASTGAGSFAAAKAHKVEAQYDIARLTESEGQLEKARQIYESIYLKDAKNVQVCHRLGIVHAKQGNYEGAKRYFNEAHLLRPSDTEILNDLGYTCFLSNDFSSAETALGKATKLDPRNHRATNNLALVVGTQGRLDESYRLFRQVNKESEAHANVAYLYAQQGQGKKALEHYSQALTIDPQMKTAANAMVEISRLQQKMETDRSTERTELAKRSPQPTPAVQQVSDAKPAVAAMPQLNDVIAEARAIEQNPSIQVVTETPIRPASASVVERPATPDVATPVFPDDVASEIDVTESADNPFLAPKTPESKSASTDADFAEPVATVAEPVVEEMPEAAVAVAAPVVAPARRNQPLANIPDDIRIAAVERVDYVALCPEADDQVKSLLDSMNSNDISQIKPALHKLGELGSKATTAAPAVRAALRHKDSYVQVHAALALWRIQENTADTMPVFVTGLQSSDPGVRSFAATALSMGPQVDSMIAPLKSAVADSNAFVRLHAAETLYQYSGQEETATQIIVTHLNDKEANVRWLATFILGEIQPQSDVVVQALTQALKDNDNRIRAGAAFALGGFGPKATSALPELKKLTRDAQPEVRKAADEAVRDIEHSSAQASSK
ncbi:MAG: HEAT repeat domain-containing protein [Planctomycetota bacterium]